MSPHRKWLVWLTLVCGVPIAARAQSGDWSEAQVIQQFLAQSPQARELRARVALAEAEARTRLVYPNPSVAYSRESAGYNAFLEASQTIPLSGRVRSLREAAAATVSAADASREAGLWSVRNDLRVAFYDMVSSQQRLATISDSLGEVQRLVAMLRQREIEGEGSRYDRLRAEREATELRIDITTARSLVAATGARVAGFLPEGGSVQRVRGELTAPASIPELDDLLRRAIGARADYRTEQRNVTRFQMEEQAARRLRIPEPEVSAGFKRADVTEGTTPGTLSNFTRNGFAFSLSVPLPIFNSGHREVSRYQAEQEQARARIAVLARRIRSEIQGAREVLLIRQDALAAYQRELDTAGSELTRVTQVAYQEGEIGILELLDSFRVNRASRLRLLDLQAGVKEASIELDRVVGEEIRP